MDLIYTDDRKNDVGVLHSYTLDIAYGVDENDFELEISLDEEVVVKEDCFIYIEGTEYGGIIDSIEVSTDDKKIIYAGRSWHGVMENKVIEPDAGYASLVVEGEANTVVRDLIVRMGLSDVFRVSDEDSGIEIVSYDIAYKSGYNGICKMLSSFDGKLKMKVENGYVLLYVENVLDYSQDEEFDQSQVDYTLKKTYNCTNHLILKGIDKDEKNGIATIYQIHLFTDENGGLQPYAKVDVPLQDSDYILDKSKQLVFGAMEICTLIEKDSVSIVENYIQLTSIPENWNNKFTDYYTYDEENDSYEKLEESTEEVYTLLTSQPTDWESNYGSYFSKDNEEKYSSVDGIEQEARYKKLKKKPKKWRENYADYYYFFTDGAHTEYKSAEGISHDKYTVQTRKPTDWDTKFTSYYRKATAKELKKDKKKVYVAVSMITKKETVTDKNGKKTTKETSIKPTWKAKKYYVKTSYTTAPSFSNKTYYKKIVDTIAPTFEAKKYYTMSEKRVVPAFAKGIYYEQVLDHYAEMISSAMEEIEEAYSCDEIEIDLNLLEQEFDIGDIVGAIEGKTGIEVFQPITKKIIKIKEDSVPIISYEVGGTSEE